MSCCGGKCGCGSSCKCGNGCNGCGMYPDVETSSTVTLIQGVASARMYSEGSEMEFGAEGCPGNCKCGSSCKCGDDCKC